MRTGPDYIQFYPTLRCNRSCGFCFNRDLPAMPDMPIGRVRHMLLSVKHAGVRTIDIMGGEPTLHRDLVALIAEMREHGLSVNISSNGSHQPLLENIMLAFPDVNVGVSINDRRTLELLREFIRMHQPIVKSVFFPAMDRSLIDSLVALAPGNYYLIYRDALDRRELSFTVPFYEFLCAVGKYVESGQAGMVFCSGFLPDSVNTHELRNVRCPAGTTKLGVMPDGSVYPCNLLFGKKEFLLGNILSDPFESIWNHSALDYFRSTPRNPCPKSACALHARCHGGCPAHGFAYAGALSASDPRCVGVDRWKREE